MEAAADLNRAVIDSLYGEALLLSDEVRAAFDLSGRIDTASADEDLARIALSCEALRTTTRMMHLIAWLLNHKAYFNGEISEFQLRRQGRLTANPPKSDPEQMAYIGGPMREIVERSRQFYARIERLDQAWRERQSGQAETILRLHQRLGEAVESF